MIESSGSVGIGRCDFNVVAGMGSSGYILGSIVCNNIWFCSSGFAWDRFVGDKRSRLILLDTLLEKQSTQSMVLIT
jgi:hypothetical protein